jgi:lipopolysaccharide biosynthesis regulator YciM
MGIALDFSWIALALLGFPLAFGLGWLASQFDLRQWRLENRQGSKAYFKGLSLLLNEEQDLAIDMFIEAIQNEPETSELHFALGNLFRRRGEYERAVRVHSHLLSRLSLSGSDRLRAQYALAQDFLKAGILDRAEKAFQALRKTSLQTQALQSLQSLYERARDWPRALEVTGELESLGVADFSARKAHYWCEQVQALQADKSRDALEISLQNTIQTYLEKAHALAPQGPRPSILLAQCYLNRQMSQAALELLLKTLEAQPVYASLLAPWVAKAGVSAQRTELAQAALEAAYAKSPSLDILEALVSLNEPGETQAFEDPGHASKLTNPTAAYAQHLVNHPLPLAAICYLGQGFQKNQNEPFTSLGASNTVPSAVVLPGTTLAPAIENALDLAVEPLMRYHCTVCGFESQQYFWQCPACQTWDSFPAKRLGE